MRIRRLALRNIRSYREAEVEFPEGILLFEGDIGTGKSTLLYAIELALFGPAEGETRKKKDFYLRGDEKEGWVRLDLEVSGKEYSFHRELNRTGSGKCKILVDGGFTEYAPSEMRKKVLEILGFNEPPGARASSVIYRYAVFTPQEEMKQILQMREDDRIQTLRKAFRIEDYKVARENAEVAARTFRSRSYAMEETAKELEELRLRLKDRTEAREKLAAELVRSEHELKAAGALAARLEEELRALEELKEKREKLELERQRLADRIEQLDGWVASAAEELKGLQGDERRQQALAPRVEEDRKLSERLEGLEETLRERQRLELGLARLREELSGAEREQARVEERGRSLKKVHERMERLAPEVEEIPSAEQSLTTYQTDAARLGEKLELIDSDIAELEEEKDGYQDLGKGQKCPKCGQELSAAHLEKVLHDACKRMEERTKEKAKLSEKLGAREEKIAACRKRLKELEERRSELRRLEGESERLAQELSEARELATKKERLEKGIAKGEEALKDREVEKEAKRLRACRPEWEQRREELSKLQGRLAGLRQRERELGQRQKELETAKEAAGKVGTEMKALDEQYDNAAYLEKKEGRENALRLQHTMEGAIEGLKRALADADSETGRLASDMKAKEEAMGHLALYREGAAWLSEFFNPALESIERHVLSHINCRFDELFRKWFGMLVDGTELDVTIDENFSPVVNQGGYELDILSLSGGEKTSVAFAYRLALNHMVLEVSGANESNLLILDEPTDGFSTEQLARVRDVLRELHAPQLILVSHERELESFADHIFKVVKESGESRVVPVAR